MRKHFEKNFYCCEICGASYKFIAPFLYHKKLHAERVPFRCDECGKEYLTKREFLKHQRLHKNE
jgi:KRAB domain-containing zinc finger protein